jgi:voltage-gated potassium channel
MTTGHLLERTRADFHRRVAPHRHSALLAAIVIAYAARPLIGDTRVSLALFSFAELLLLLVALYNINLDELVGERERLLSQSKRRLRLGWGLAAVAALERVLSILVESRVLDLVGFISWFLFLVFVISSLLRSVLKQREVTGETISMAISIYLLLGFTWALLYAVILQLHPDSFGGLAVAQSGHPVRILRLFPVLGYFSLTTLSTIGFGDITPLSLQARYAAVAEGITGQFYLAILVARLVGLQMSRSTSLQPEK